MKRLVTIIASVCLLAVSCRTTHKSEYLTSRLQVDSSATVTTAIASGEVAAEIRIDSVILCHDTAGVVTVSARGIRKRRFERNTARVTDSRDTVSRRIAAESRSEAQARPSMPGLPLTEIAFLIACILLIVILKWKRR